MIDMHSSWRTPAGLIALFLAGLALLSGSSFPPSSAAPAPRANAAGSASFAGIATDMLTGRPVEGVRISLRGDGTETTTGARGEYTLAVPPGEWEVCASAKGFVAMSHVLQIARAGSTTRLDFALVKANPSAAEEAILTERLRADGERVESELPQLQDGVTIATVPSTIRVLMTDGHVVVMDLEEYLKGVVPPEIGIYAPAEALKAQAIAARCYAAVAVAYPRHAAQGADVCTTTDCQVWTSARYAPTDQAVEQTRGVVAAYNGGIISANYFGHCNGYTRNSEDVPNWPGNYVPYLRSVPCICGNTEYFGHGAGMCQLGAIAMAQQGASAADIILHYYTGVVVENWAGPTPTPTALPTAVPTATPTPPPYITITYRLQQGWNSISIPMTLQDTRVASVLAPIAGSYDLVEAWDSWNTERHWLVYDATQPIQWGGLENLSPQQGIFVRALQPATLTLTGPRLTSPSNIELSIGPNLVGYPAGSTRTVPVALASISGKYAHVFSYDAAHPERPWLVYDVEWPPMLNTLTVMVPGHAYCIWTYEPCTWHVDP